MIKGEKIKRNVGRRIIKKCHLLDMQAVRLSLTMVGTTDEETTETMSVQAGRGIIVVKLLHPLHHTVITTAPMEGKEDDMAEEVVAEAEVRLQGTAATADIRDDLYPRTTQGT